MAKIVMVSGFSFGASYIVKFGQPVDWFVVAPALMAAHRIVIPFNLYPTDLFY